MGDRLRFGGLDDRWFEVYTGAIELGGSRQQALLLPGLLQPRLATRALLHVLAQCLCFCGIEKLVEKIQHLTSVRVAVQHGKFSPSARSAFRQARNHMAV